MQGRELGEADGPPVIYVSLNGVHVLSLPMEGSRDP